MRELLLGWLIKGQYNVSLLDAIIMFIEIIVVVSIVYGIKIIIEKIKRYYGKR